MHAGHCADSWELQKMEAITFQLVLALIFLFSLQVYPSQAADRSVKNVNVGLLLDFSMPEVRFSNSCIEMAIEDFYSSRNGGHTKRMVLHRRYYKSDVIEAAAAATDLLENIEVEAILGPVRSGDAEFVANLGDKAKVPIISFTATSPSLSLAKNGFFLRTAQSDQHQVGAIVDIVKAYRWGEVVLIYEDNEFGKGMIPFLTDELQGVYVKVPSRAVLADSHSDEFLKKELNRLKSNPTRVFVVHMTASLGKRLFKLVRELEMLSEGYVWIITNGMANLLDSFSKGEIASVQGILGVKTYVPKSDLLKTFTVRWRRRFLSENPDHKAPPFYPNLFGLWAYDTIWALASALEKTNAGSSKYHHHGKKQSNSTGVFGNLGVSPTGPNILHAMKSTRSVGLSGNFVLIDGQLTSSIFEIVNVFGNGKRRVGFWSPTSGLSGTLGDSRQNDSNLNTVYWPGNKTAVPRGWEIPTRGTKLKIGVPVKAGFNEFLKVQWNQSNNLTTVEGGYCIDVFKKVLEVMPYDVPYEFLAFANASGGPEGDYNHLVHQVFLKNYDAVVGDTTIRANRSQYVDFTLPYTETGVSMIVPMKAERKMNALIFLKPLTTELWLTSGGFFIFTGFVVWILEHRINPEFRGPPLEQFGLVYYFAFSTMVFAHRERLASNLSRLVVIIWVFVVLILTQSYTASLTSMLTVQQLQPTVTDIQALKQYGENIGLQKGSFVRGLLVDQLKVNESKLREYNSAEEYADALIKGSKNGGVGAIFDEIPFIKLFLAKYCDGFAMVGPTYKAGGFGFVFPKRSPLVADVSRAILNVTEGDNMVEIDKSLYRNQMCVNFGREMDSNRLSLSRLRGLFVLTGTTSAVALILFVVRFFYDYLNTISVADTSTRSATWQRIRAIRIRTMFKHFDQKNMSSHTFRNMNATN